MPVSTKISFNNETLVNLIRQPVYHNETNVSIVDNLHVWYWSQRLNVGKYRHVSISIRTIWDHKLMHVPNTSM